MQKLTTRKWLLTIVLLCCMVVFFAYGFVAATYQIFPYKIIKYAQIQKRNWFAEPELKRTGLWRPVRDNVRKKGEKERKAISKLASLPYLSGSASAPDVSNITVYKKAAYDGLNLVVSGHAPECFLMDMKGKVLHKWSYKFEDVWPGPLGFNEWDNHKRFWRCAHLFPNGDLLAIFEGIGMIKLDKDSNLLWSFKGRCHHALFVDEDGYIFTLSRRERKEHDRLQLEGPILEDFITVLDANGREVKSFSLLTCLLDSKYAPLAADIPKKNDVFHTNAIEVLDGRFVDRYPMFKKGHILVSIPTLNMIAIVDPEEEIFTWALTGMWRYQHEPTVLDNGNLLLFDNAGNHGKSKVVEFNPATQEVAWAYRGSDKDVFWSETLGANQRLPNGNTLITESNNGRAFEVTPENEIVWEFINPYRAGENNELIATLFAVRRIEPSRLSGQWLSAATN